MTLSDFEMRSWVGHLSSYPGGVPSIMAGAADSGRRVSRAIESHGNWQIKMIQPLCLQSPLPGCEEQGCIEYD